MCCSLLRADAEHDMYMLLTSLSELTLRRPMTTVPAACTRSSAPASANGLLGAKVCSPSSIRGHAALGLGRIVEVNDSHAGVQYYSGYAASKHPNVTFSWPLDSSSLVVVGPSEKLERHLAKQGVDCWALNTGNGSSRAAQTLSSVQQRVDRAVYEGAWHRNLWRSPHIPQWHSASEASLLHGQPIVVLGASPMRQLAEHLPALFSGIFDHGPIHEPHETYTSCDRPFGKNSLYSRRYEALVHPLDGQAICSMLPCSTQQGQGCSQCFCCCECEGARQCGDKDFDVRANASGVASIVHFTAKPELAHTADDRAAMEARFCRDPPPMLVFSKGVHEAYFDVFTLRNGSVARKDAERVTGEEHAASMQPLLREYISSTFSCLPDSTLVVMVTPYHSNKAPWQAPLVQSTYDVMVSLLEEGLFARNRILFVDGHHMSLCGGTQSTDGNHYDTSMQTAVWTVLAYAFRLWTEALRSD